MQRGHLHCEAELIALLPALKTRAYRFARNRHDAEDLVQETVLKALVHIDQFDGRDDGGLRRWMFTILRNTFMTHFKRSRREPVGAMDDVSVIDMPFPETQNRTVHLHDVEIALSHLPEGKQKVLSLVVAGSSYEDVARQCNCEVGTVKSQLSRARVALMKELGEKSLAEAAALR